jgi:hypothetical protein
MRLPNLKLSLADLAAVALFCKIVWQGSTTWPDSAAFIFAILAGMGFKLVEILKPTKVSKEIETEISGAFTAASCRMTKIEDDIKSLRSALSLKRE